MSCLIIKYYEVFTLHFRGAPDAFPQWLKVWPDEKKKGRLKTKHISKEEAMAAIREEGLVEVHKDKDGKVWDTPDRAFQKKYKGRVEIPLVV